jgi:cobalt-zinc-cadmium efflux system outer membrane protein
MDRSTLYGGALLCVALSHVLVAHAAEPANSPLRLEALVAAIEEQNPQLKSRQAEVRAARERPAQARAFDDPMLMMELWQVPLSFQHVPLMFTLRQPIPWPGKLRARAAAVEPDARRAQMEVAATARTLRLEATRAYYNYRLAVRTEEVLGDAQKLLAVIVASVDARYRVGRADLTELLKAQESLSTSENLLLDVDRERELAISSINTLLARSPGEPLGMPITEPPLHALPDEPALTARALAQRPELQAVQASMGQAQARAQAASVERAPDLAVWASFMAMLRGGSDHTFSVGVQSSIPSFSLAKSGAARREALAQIAGQRESLRQVEAQVRGEIHAALLRAETAARHIRLHRESLIPLAERAVRAAQAGYQNGRVELVLLLETTRSLLDHRIDGERYVAEYGQRLAELEAAMGGSVWEVHGAEGAQR